MKMKIFSLILVVAISLLAFAACNNSNGGGSEECEHTFDTEWATNDTEHWHAATCEHGEIKDSLAKHSDEDQDGKCDVCEFAVGHSHTYESEWTYDEYNHWKKATCLHTDEKGEYDLHSDLDLNNLCDECGSHAHSVNPMGFCTDKSCGKKVKDVNENDFGSLAAAVLFQKHLVNGADITYKFNGPSLNEDYLFRGVWQSYNSYVEKDISVLFGVNGYVHTETETSIIYGTIDAEGNKSSGYSESASGEKSWHEIDGDSAFGVMSFIVDGEESDLQSDNVVDKLDGVLFNLSTVADGYGTENFLYSIYKASQGENVSDFEASYNPENNSVVITFNVLNVHKTEGTVIGAGQGDDAVSVSGRQTVYNVNYYEIELSFCYNDDFALTNLDVSCDVYKNDVGQLHTGAPNVLDITIKYNVADGSIDFVNYAPDADGADSDGFVVVDKSEVIPQTYSYSVTQTVGERTAENAYPKVKFIPESFDLFKDAKWTEKIEGTLELGVDQSQYIHIGNFSPEGTSFDLIADALSYQILDSDGNVMDNTNAFDLPLLDENDPDYVEGEERRVAISEDFRSFYSYDVIYSADSDVSSYDRKIWVMPKTAGAYTLVVYMNGVEMHRVSIIAN